MARLGIHKLGKRYAFTNILKVPFTTKWNGIPFTIPPGETVEISDLTPIPRAGMGHALSEKMLREMVNNIFIEKAKKETEEAHKRGDHYFRSNYTTLMSIKEQREVYEKQILHELEDLPETPSLQAIKLQFRETFSENVNRKPKTPVESMKDENMSIIKSKNEKLMEAAKKSNPLQ